ncbi:hypothetical protein [Desulfobacter vibrioformis]|uniref:hypothetical protein n=1 Tax=Desulfobacter vibrioformis TaxID=34031 RepID=UPI000558687E|nr:hypothetical protein [Desulfobacter vibrioformis]
MSKNQTIVNVAGYLAYACIWVSTAAGVCFAVYATGESLPVVAFLIPAMFRIRTETTETNDSEYRRGLDDAWEAVQEWIIPGELPGDGTDRAAQRNGLVLAADAIRELMDRKKVAE